VVKAMQLPIWENKAGDPAFNVWVTSLEEYFYLNGIGQADWVGVLRVAVQGRPKQWLMNQDDLYDWSYDRCIEELEKEFDHHAAPVQAAAALANRGQGENESVHAYFRRLNEAYNRMYAHLPSGPSKVQRDPFVMGQAYMGVREEIKNGAHLASNATTQAEMKDMYFAVELNLKSMNRLNKRVTSSSRSPSPAARAGIAARTTKPGVHWATNCTQVDEKDRLDQQRQAESAEDHQTNNLSVEEAQKAFRAENRDLFNSFSQQIEGLQQQVQRLAAPKTQSYASSTFFFPGKWKLQVWRLPKQVVYAVLVLRGLLTCVEDLRKKAQASGARREPVV
jgi:hypothetical protein